MATRTLSRREVLALLGGGVAAGLTAGAAGTLKTRGAQIAASPPAAQPASGGVPATGSSVADKAAALDYDIGKILRFVADEIHYEPYSGALRGATGTLWARAGNSIDKTMLLAALLDAALVDYRYVSGPLDESAARTLQSRVVLDPGELRARWRSQVQDALSGSSASSTATPAPLSPQDQLLAMTLEQSAARVREQAASHITSNLSAISQALAQANIKLPAAPSPDLPESERTRHTWLQMADGPAWVDLDPSFPGATQGKALATPASNGPIPDDLFHRVRFTVVAEEVISGQPQRRDAATYEVKSIDLLNVPVAVFFTPPSQFKGLGLSINQIFTGRTSLMPVIVSSLGGAYASTPVVFGSGGGFEQALGEATPAGNHAEGETIGIWLAVEVESPGQETLRVERTILDRVPPEARAANKIDLSGLAPVHLVKNPDGTSTISELGTAWTLSVATARLPSILMDQPQRSFDTFGPFLVAGPAYTTLREALAIEQENSRGHRSYLDRPNVTAFGVTLDGAGGADIVTDLLVQHSITVQTGTTGAAAGSDHPQVVAGVINQVAEQLLFSDSLATGDVRSRSPVTMQPTAGTIFAQATNDGVPIRAVTRLDQLSGIQISPVGEARVRAAIGAGQVVVLPARPVSLDGQARSAWWIIDPATGRTRDEMENGRGSAGVTLHANLPAATDFSEYTLLDLMIDVANWLLKYKRLISCVVGIAVLAAGVIGFTVGVNTAQNQGATGGAVAGIAGGVVGTVGGLKSLAFDCALGG